MVQIEARIAVHGLHYGQGVDAQPGDGDHPPPIHEWVISSSDTKTNSAVILDSPLRLSEHYNMTGVFLCLV